MTGLGRQDEAVKAHDLAIQLNENIMDKSQAANETMTNSVEAKDTGNITAKVYEAKNNTTKNDAHNVESKKQPDFGSVLTIISILSVAYITFARKQ